jgi:hypothetical protein
MLAPDLHHKHFTDVAYTFKKNCRETFRLLGIMNGKMVESNIATLMLVKAACFFKKTGQRNRLEQVKNDGSRVNHYGRCGNRLELVGIGWNQLIR